MISNSKLFLGVCALVGLGLGCGQVKTTPDDAAPPADATSSTSDGGGDVCTGNLMECDSTCVNTDTNHDYCGDCSTKCDSSQVCSGGHCTNTCDSSLMECSGSCVDTTSDRDHCGDCSTKCAVDQTCVSSGCVQLSDVAVPQFDKVPPKKIGWTVYPSNTPLTFTFKDVGLPEAIYECRTGPASTVAALSFSRCDGAGGTTAIHQPTPDANIPEGSYRTEMRIRVNTWTSGTIGYNYYVHHSLDNVQPCAAADPATVFAAATLPKTGAFAGTLQIEKPFVNIPFQNVIVTSSLMYNGWGSVTNGSNYTVQLMSLRRRFTLSPDGNYLLIQRTFESRTARKKANQHICRNGFKFGATNTSLSGSPSKSTVDCANMVVNRRGQAECVVPGSAARLTSDIAWVKLSHKGLPNASFSAKSRMPACTGTWFSEMCIYLPD